VPIHQVAPRRRSRSRNLPAGAGPLLTLAVLSPTRILTPFFAALAALALLCGAAAARTAGIFTVDSGGYGHGIGMSQYGALGYAQHGKDYRFILGHYYRGTSIGHTDAAQTVTVLLDAGGQPTFSGATRAAGTRLEPGTSYTVRPGSNGALTLVYPAVTNQHKRVSRQLGPFAAPLTVSGAGPLRLAGQGSFDGSLLFRPAGGANVQTVEAVSLEDYIRGVVPDEVSASWPAQALEAQAVAARTYAITNDVGGADYMVYDDTRSQAYGGAGAETAATNAAVAATAGDVVTYGGRPVITYFFSSSGGHTESIQNEWLGATPEPWLVGVPDPYDAAGGLDPYHHVHLVMSMAAAAAKLHGLFSGTFEGIRVLRHGVSPRVITARVLGSRASRVVSGWTLQTRFGLRTNWEVFHVISESSGSAPSGTGGTAAEAAAAIRAAHRRGADPVLAPVSALLPLVDTMLVRAIPGMHGAVIPGRRGERIAVQLREHGRWRTVARPRLRAGGAYDIALPGRGTYRVLAGRLAAPSVAVG
jgi:stage II sporulation protein D